MPHTRTRIRFVLLAFLLTLASAVAGAIHHCWRDRSITNQTYAESWDTQIRWMWPAPHWPEPAASMTYRTIGYALESRYAESIVSSRHMQWQTRYRAGWPFHALERRDYEGQPWFITPRHLGRFIWNGIRGGLQIDLGFTTPGWRGVALIPTLPVWHGLLADITFYWLLTGGLYELRARAIRRRRLARNQCLNCDYSLDTLSTCPECGTPSPRGTGVLRVPFSPPTLDQPSSPDPLPSLDPTPSSADSARNHTP